MHACRQIIKYNWDGLALPLRHASVALHNETYKELLCSLCGSYDAYVAQQLNLIMPPLFNVSAAQCNQTRGPSYAKGGRGH